MGKRTCERIYVPDDLHDIAGGYVNKFKGNNKDKIRKLMKKDKTMKEFLQVNNIQIDCAIDDAFHFYNLRMLHRK